jgi:hypothetical protein
MYLRRQTVLAAWQEFRSTLLPGNVGYILLFFDAVAGPLWDWHYHYDLGLPDLLHRVLPVFERCRYAALAGF